MLRAQHLRNVLPLALAAVCFGAIGCAGDDPEPGALADESALSAPSQDLAEIASTGGGLEGTWVGADSVDMIQKLVLLTDGRYHVVRDSGCLRDGCDPLVEQDGRYAIYGRDSMRVLALTQRGSRFAEPFEYALAGSSLRLRSMRSVNGWFTLNHSSSSWCGSPRDCNLQSLPPGICAGGYECASSVCTWTCGGSLPTE